MEAATQQPIFASRYRLLGALGQGAHATVWRARDVETGAEVAVKRLRPDVALAREWRERLRREARALGALRHPGIVRAIEIGEEPSGTPYLVMELLDGETLADRLARRGALAPARAIALARDLLDALARVHAGGLVHRDVKPSNVMLVRSPTPRTLPPGVAGAGERAVLLDFGLARLVDPSGAERDELAVTGAGARVGTPRSMSPEQARGVPRIDARADVWAVGVALYEMLAGRAPFGGVSALAVMHAVLVTAPAPLVGPDGARVDPGLERVVLRALEKSPERRFPSATAMREALDALGPLRAPADDPPRRALAR